MRETPLSGRDLSAVLLIVLIWGSNFVAMKIGLRSFTPFQLGLIRYLFVIFPLIFVVKRPNIAWQWLMIYGFFQGFAQFGFLFISLKVGMTAALASVVLQTQIFFTALFSYIFLKEKPNRFLWIGLFFAGAGLLCFGLNFILFDGQHVEVTTVMGFVLCLCAATMWASANVIIRLIGRHTKSEFDALGFIVWCGLLSNIPFAITTFLIDDPASQQNWFHASWQSWVSLAYLGWISILVANTLWTKLIRIHGANKIAPFSLAIPIFGLVAGIFFLDETINRLQWWGIALIFLALAQVIFGSRR